MQTILGSGGAIGIPLAKELRNFTGNIRLVSRNPVKINDTDQLFPADLKDPGQIDNSIKGSEVVYVTVGFEYNLRVWKDTWPVFIENVINSCLRHESRLVFFDNMYMYSKDSVPFMTENAVIDPPSEKGKVRMKVRELILSAGEKKNLKTLIARSADFYGPWNRNSALGLMVAENLIKGKKAQAFGDPGMVHTFTYTPDAARATAILGNSPDAYGQEWHVPTTRERLTMQQWMELIANELGTGLRVQKIPVFMIRMLGLFVPIMREFPEMLYQYEQNYIFDSSKFEKKFGVVATPPSDGIRAFVESMKKTS